MSSKLIVDTIEDSTGTYSLALGSGNSTFPGGIHIGGTGSANLLDDYEEGTWTPVTLVNGFSQTVILLDDAHYTKIGRFVYLEFKITLNSSGYSNTYSHFGGLPFTVSDNQVLGRYASGSISGNGSGGAVYLAGGGIYLYQTSGATASSGWSPTWNVSFVYKTN